MKPLDSLCGTAIAAPYTVICALMPFSDGLGGGFSKKQYASIADSELAMKVLKEGD